MPAEFTPYIEPLPEFTYDFDPSYFPEGYGPENIYAQPYEVPAGPAAPFGTPFYEGYQMFPEPIAPAYEIGPSGLETQREQMLVAEQPDVSYLDPYGYFRAPENLREEALASGAMRGDIGDTALGRAASWLVEPIEPLADFSRKFAETVARPFQISIPTSGMAPSQPIETPFSEAARFGARVAVPTTPLELALELAPGLGDARGIFSALRGAGFGDDVARAVATGGRAALEPTVVRLAAFPDALVPLEEGGLMASRGAMAVADPAGVRILNEGEQLRPGEMEVLHGGVNGLQGAPRIGLNVTPIYEDAQRFAEFTARSIRAGLQEAPSASVVSRETGVPRFAAEAEARQMQRQGLGGALTGEPGASRLALAGGAEDARIQKSIRDEISGLPSRPVGDEELLMDEAAQRIRLSLEGDLPPGSERGDWLTMIRGVFTPQEWAGWKGYVTDLSPAERAARGKEWTDFIDAAVAAPTPAARTEVLSDLKDRLGQEMLAARQWMAQDAVSSFSRQFGREPGAADVAAIHERLGLIEETLSRINVDLANRRLDDWLRMPGGVEPGRAPGARWSRESADYYGPVGAGRGGRAERSLLAAIAGGAPTPEPFKPGRLHSAAARVVDIANIPTGAIAGADYTYLVTHAGPLGARHLEEYKNALAAGVKALADYPTEINRVRTEVLPVVDNIDDLRAALGPIDHPVANDAFSLMARLESQGRDFASIKQSVGELLQSPAARLVNDMRVNSVWAREGVQGPHISSVAGSLTQREEQVVSRIFEGLPVYREAQRQSTVMLDKFRSDVTDTFINQLKNKGDPTYVDPLTRRLTQAGRNEAQHYANQVSRMTGWGDLGPLENYADLLRGPLFSARYTSSLVERVAGLNPLATGHPFGPAWRQAVQDQASFVLLGLTIMGLASYAGAEVGVDPRKANWGDIQLGNQHINIWGGNKALTRTIYQMATDQKVDSTGALRQPGVKNQALDYLRNRLSVPAGEAANIAFPREDRPSVIKTVYESRGRGTEGFKDNLEAFSNVMAPIWIQDVVGAIVQDGLMGGLKALPSTIGAGVSTWNEPSIGNVRFDEREEFLKMPETQALLPPESRDKPFGALTITEQGIITRAFNEARPDIASRYAESRRAADDPFQLARDQNETIKQAFGPLYDNAQERAFNLGQLSGRDLRTEIQSLKAAENQQVNALYTDPEYKARAESAKEFAAGRREAGGVLEDLLSAKPGSVAGKALDFLGLRSAPEPGRAPATPGEIQDLMDKWYSLPSEMRTTTKEGKDVPNWDSIETVRAIMLEEMRRSDPALATRFEWNIAPRQDTRDPEIVQLYDKVQRDVVTPYYALPFWPDEGQKWNAQDYANWINWRETHPFDEAMLYLFGYIQELRPGPAESIVKGIAPAMPVKVAR